MILLLFLRNECRENEKKKQFDGVIETFFLCPSKTSLVFLLHYFMDILLAYYLSLVMRNQESFQYKFSLP